MSRNTRSRLSSRLTRAHGSARVAGGGPSGPPSGSTRVTPAGDTRVTPAGDTRIIA